VSKPIIVGYDPTTLDHIPVDFAASFAGLTGARLIVAAVQAGSPVLPVSTGALPVALRQIDEDLVADCTQAIEQLEQRLKAAGVDAECRKLRGTSAARALHEAAESEGAGLLVIGSSRRGAAGRVLMGSTATRLVHGAPCPVTVVPRGWTDRRALGAIGAAYVDSDEAREALRGAHALARRAGATLRVLNVVKVTPAMLGETEPTTAARPGKGLTAVAGEHRAQAERALRQVVAGLDGDVAVEVDVFVGEPAEILIDLSDRLEMLVCGSRGYGPIRAVMLGSVSRRVVAEARCPVIVVPRGVTSSLADVVAEAPAAAGRR
jgi:nucleotide-binding universal stress UspA family protein